MCDWCGEISDEYDNLLHYKEHLLEAMKYVPGPWSLVPGVWSLNSTEIPLEHQVNETEVKAETTEARDENNPGEEYSENIVENPFHEYSCDDVRDQAAVAHNG